MASWRAKICESLPAARPAFSVGHFDPLILLRSESGCHLGNLIFNDLEALQVESSGHFDHLIFTEWGVTCYRKTEVFKIITPVASLRLKSSSQSGNLIQQEYKSSYGKRNLISEILPNSHFEDLGAGNLSVTVFWYFPKLEAPLY